MFDLKSKKNNNWRVDFFVFCSSCSAITTLPESLSCLVTTATGRVTLLHLPLFMPSYTITSQPVCIHCENVFPVECFSLSGTHHFAAVYLLPFNGNVKLTQPMWNPNEQWSMETLQSSQQQLKHQRLTSATKWRHRSLVQPTTTTF